MNIKRLPLFSIAIFSCLYAEEKVELDPNISEAFGHMIYTNFARLDVPFDIGKIIQGIQDAAVGKESPIPVNNCIEAIHAEQEKKFKILCKKNRDQAEVFLASNAKQEGMTCLEGGKIQYQLVSQGKGSEVKQHFSPLLRFSVKTVDGLEICPPNSEEPISLDEAIEGLKIGVLGMKEREKRILYVHPDYAYGEKGFSSLLPNALLIFEIEVLKANTR